MDDAKTRTEDEGKRTGKKDMHASMGGMAPWNFFVCSAL